MTFRTAPSPRGTVSVPAIVRALAATIAALALAHIGTLLLRWSGHARAWGLVPLFDVNVEENVPSFFSGLLFVANALAAAMLAWWSSGRADRLAWSGVSASALFLGYDELFRVHEQLTGVSMRLSQWLFGASPMFAWIVLGSAGSLAALALLTPLLRRMHPALRRRLLIAAGVFLAGALGVEWPEGEWYRTHREDLVFGIFALVEECLEMTGCLLALRALLLELARQECFVRWLESTRIAPVND